MFCQKHPKMKMTMLFTSFVCDSCNPPKGMKPVEPESEVKTCHDYDDMWLLFGGASHFLNCWNIKESVANAGTPTPQEIALHIQRAVLLVELPAVRFKGFPTTFTIQKNVLGNLPKFTFGVNQNMDDGLYQASVTTPDGIFYGFYR